MAYEIELKAWVDDWESVGAELRRRCGEPQPVHKRDRYFHGPSGDLQASSFRLREESGRPSMVTFKEKRVVDGIEHNREREFAVDDPEAFLEFVDRTGCTQYSSKEKKGLAFRSGDMLVELVTVEGIGTFLEIELIVESDDADTQEKAARQVREFLARTGIADEKIETLPYVVLLRRNEVGEDFTGGV